MVVINNSGLNTIAKGDIKLKKISHEIKTKKMSQESCIIQIFTQHYQTSIEQFHN